MQIQLLFCQEMVLASQGMHSLLPDQPLPKYPQEDKSTRPFCGVEPDRFYMDRGYSGHDYEGEAKVMISGQRRGLTAQMKRERKRRSAIEATIGHMKTDGRLNRNFPNGKDGDAINALLVAECHNLRLSSMLSSFCGSGSEPSSRKRPKRIFSQCFGHTKLQWLRYCSAQAKYLQRLALDVPERWSSE